MSATTPKSVFLGMTGASGAAYGLRLLAALAACGCDVTLCVSDSGLLVLRDELGLRDELELADEGREAVVAALVARAGAPAAVHVVDPADIGAPAASGSAAPDAVVVCPCSMSSAAHIALGTSRNLIHRAADVALKERRPLVVVPRETPLSAVHLRRLLELAEAGAVVLPAMPGFYVHPTSVGDLVDHIAGKVLQTLGFDQRLFPPWEGGVR